MVAGQRKPSEIFRRMSDVYEKACFGQKMSTNWLNYSKKNVSDEDRPERPTRVRTPTMIKSVNDTIQSERRMKVKDIAHILNISWNSR